jgi:hypothetical protein
VQTCGSQTHHFDGKKSPITIDYSLSLSASCIPDNNVYLLCVVCCSVYLMWSPLLHRILLASDGGSQFSTAPRYISPSACVPSQNVQVRDNVRSIFCEVVAPSGPSQGKWNQTICISAQDVHRRYIGKRSSFGAHVGINRSSTCLELHHEEPSHSIWSCFFKQLWYAYASQRWAHLSNALYRARAAKAEILHPYYK